MKLVLPLLLVAMCVCSASDSVYTEADVKAFVRPGMSRSDLIKRFGRPLIDDEHPNRESGDTSIDEIMHFVVFEAHPTPTKDWVFAGFVVRLKDQKIVSWDVIHRTTQ
jgi:hypothetical protein